MHTVVMNEDVIRAAINLDQNIAWEDTWDHHPKSLRHQAYRQFIYHVAGTTGLQRRLIVPSCIAWAIRNKWPDPDGVYTDFKAATGNKSVVLIWTVENGLKVLRGATATTTALVSVDSDSSSDSS